MFFKLSCIKFRCVTTTFKTSVFFALLVSSALAERDGRVLSTTEEFRTLLRAEQVAALPAVVAVTQEVGEVVFDPATTNDAAWFAPVGTGPALAFEDAVTRDTVLTNPATGGAARLAPEENYDPDWIARQVDGLTDDQISEVAPFYDPALVTISFALVFPDGGSSDTPGRAASPLESDLSPGLPAAFYEIGEPLEVLPDLSSRSVSRWTTVPTVDFPNSAAPWPCADARFVDDFACRFSGFLRVPESGVYRFSLGSDDGAVFLLDGVPAVDRDGLHEYGTSSATLDLEAGLYEIRIDFFENGGTAGLRLFWTSPGGAEEIVPADCLFHEPPPAFAPGVRLLPPDPAPCRVGNAVALSAEAWAFQDRSVARVDFYADGEPVASATNAPFVAVWEPPAPGAIVLSAVASDTAGLVSPTASRTLAVRPSPAGYAPGVVSDYYALSSKPGALPDFSVPSPVLTRIERQIDHTEGAPWPGLALTAGKLFASRHTGALFAPATGDYTLFLESAEVAALLLDGEPVLAATSLAPFWAQAAADGEMWIVDALEDAHVWRNRLVTMGVPDTVDIELRVYVAGVLFDDLTIVRRITSADLDDAGEYVFDLIKPDRLGSSACHTVRFFQGGAPIGEACYAGLLLPDELR